MIKKFLKAKMIITIICGVLVFGICLNVGLGETSLMNSNEWVTLSMTGISMPYWLFVSLGYILLPLICSIMVYSALEFIEQKMQS